MTTPTTYRNGHVHELSDKEAWELFDQRARQYLGLGAEEFLAKWDAGAFGDPENPYRPDLMHVVMLLPLVEHTR